MYDRLRTFSTTVMFVYGTLRVPYERLTMTAGLLLSNLVLVPLKFKIIYALTLPFQII
jgi:hypothetical protein